MTINYSDQEVIKDQKSIFLAGPTPREEDATSWRTDACQFLEDNGFDGVVYVPEYSTWKPKGDYVDQAQWERDALLNTSVIAFWIPRKLPDMPAFTTNVEFGYWLHTGKVLYGRPDSAEKIKYLDWLYKVDTDMEPYNSIEDLLLSSIDKANEVGIYYENEMLPLQKRKIFMKDERIRELQGANMDIDLISENLNWEQTRCPWNENENTKEHKCAVKDISICKYFCGIKYLDKVLCSYPHDNKDVVKGD